LADRLRIAQLRQHPIVWRLCLDDGARLGSVPGSFADGVVDVVDGGA
jgi:hypothetical protein